MGNRTCPKCGHGNPMVARYCGQCGVALADEVRPSTQPAAPGAKQGTYEPLYRDYWAAFRRPFDARNMALEIRRTTGMWRNFMGRSTSTWLSAGVCKAKQRLTVLLVIGGDKRVAYLNLLKQDQRAIEQEIGHALEWQELPKNKECFIRLDIFNTRIDDRTDWPRQHELLLDLLERFHRAFAQRVKQKGIT